VTTYQMLARMHPASPTVRTHAGRLSSRLGDRVTEAVEPVTRGWARGATRLSTFRGTGPATRIQPAVAAREALEWADGGT